MDAKDIVILAGARTPVGKFQGSLKDFSPTELGVIAAKEAMVRAKVDPNWIDSIIVGNAIQSAKDSAYLARHIGLKSAIKESANALIVNRLCGSGLESIVQGVFSLQRGESEFVLAGGAENMSMTPYSMRGVREGWSMGENQVDDMLYSALTDSVAGCQIGETVEYLAEQFKIDRQEADEAAVRSHELAARARDRGRLKSEIIGIESKTRPGKSIEIDESIRPGTSVELLKRLPPLYRENGVITAGNSAGLNDAAAMVVMTTYENAKEKGLPILGKFKSWGSVGVNPKSMGIGPVPATRLALKRAHLSLDDLDLVEINDSFAVQYLAVKKELGLKEDRVNPNGGGLSIGHPMGASGTRLTISALNELKETDKKYALVTLCIGGGQGISVILEGIS